MSTRRETCSAVVKVDGTRFCKNGFPLTGACLGTGGTPVCMNEDRCAHLFAPTGGRPRFLSEQEAHRG